MKPDCLTAGSWLEDYGTLDRKSQIFTILMLGYQRLHPKMLRILLPMNFSVPYLFSERFLWTSLKLL
jgi:hypothetical protein